MTQLVQLQSIAADLADNGFTVFAISNDPLEVLTDFAATHDIDYPLLSDADSEVIRSFGIMNQLISQEEGKGMRWYGIPYPGTYFVGGDGLITDKDFHQHHARRASGAAVLARAIGQDVEVDPDTVVSHATDDVRITLGLADPALQLELITELIVELDVPPGQHIYAPGSPDAFTPLAIDVKADGVRVGEPAWPEPHQLSMSELDLTAPTYDGVVRVAVPITVTSDIARLGHEIKADTIDLEVVVQFQMCDDVTCGLPQSAETVLTVPLTRLVEPEGLGIYAARVEAKEAETGKEAR